MAARLALEHEPVHDRRAETRAARLGRRVDVLDQRGLANVEQQPVGDRPQLGGDVRRHRRHQQQQRVDGERRRALLVEQVGELHERGDRGVVRPALEVVGDPGDQPVGGPVDDVDRRRRPRRSTASDDGSASRHSAVQEPRAAFDARVVPVDVVRRRADEQVEQAQRVGADRVEVLLGRDQVALRLRHLVPPMRIMPCVNSRVNGSRRSFGAMPRSASALVKKRAYIRCRMACSTPPMYWSTGIQRGDRVCENGASAFHGSQKRRKYHDESTNVSIVSVSRTAGPAADRDRSCAGSPRGTSEQYAWLRFVVLLLGVGAGLVSGLASAAQAQTTGAGVAPAEEGPIWSAEYWAKKGNVSLNLWRKRVGAPKQGERPLPLLFLVHGSSNSARSSYDLTVAGKGEYSFMNVFARYGYDVWTMDHDGYGYSGSSGNNSDIASSVEDLKAAMPVVAKETGQPRMHFYGTSSGAIRAAAFAQVEPERVDRLVLGAFTYKGTGAPEIGIARARSTPTAAAIAASATPP